MAVEDDDSSAGPRLGFESVSEELSADLAVEGRLPPWLTGTFVRNGPGLFEAGGREVAHWFDGPALLRGFEFEPASESGDATDSRAADGDRVRYRNRFLRTEAYEAVRSGEVAAAGFAESADRGLLDRLRNLLPEPTDNANADVARLGGEYVALTESPRAVRFDLGTLSTEGELAWADDLPVGHTTPHLRPAPDGEGHVGYLTEFLPRSSYRLFRVGPSEPRREQFARVPVEEPAYMHSLAVADRFAVLVEPPFLIPPHRVLTGSGSMVDRYEWRPQRGTRFVVVDRETGAVVCSPTTAPFLVFHHANAYREGEQLVVDLVAFDSPAVLRGMYLEELRASDGGGGGELRRYRVPLSGATPTVETLATGVSMPTVDDRRTGRRYRHVYCQHTDGDGPADEVVRVDVATGETATWTAAAYVSEPVFVPRGDGDAAGDPPATPEGAVLVEVLDPERRRSGVVVLDAAEMSERARVWAPHHLPFGFHGSYFEGV
jgi:carotenoid cleavage dioxygenase-like enzyme